MTIGSLYISQKLTLVISVSYEKVTMFELCVNRVGIESCLQTFNLSFLFYLQYKNLETDPWMQIFFLKCKQIY